MLVFKSKELMVSTKAQLKTLAKEIRKSKDEMKRRMREREGGYARLQWQIPQQKADYRHKHIAMCVLRGTPREMIEHPDKDNMPDEALISSYLSEWGVEYAEPTVCAYQE